jgi:lysophospholipase L1-like esterase
MKPDRPNISLTTLLASPGKFLKTAKLVTKLPPNQPKNFLAKSRPSKTIVACLGDSITHGNVSYNWVDVLGRKLKADGLHFINAGINSSVAWQLNQRLGEIIDSKPDIAIVLIGTNDVMGSFHTGDGLSYKRKGKLAATPTQAGYRLELTKLLRGLQAIPHVAVCTLPPLGEDPESSINQLVQSFNADIRSIVAQENRTLIPLDEHLRQILATQSIKPLRQYTPGPINRLLPILRAITDYYIHGLTWDESGNNQGLTLLPDHIHLGEIGGGILADLVEQYIKQFIQTP